MRLGLKGSCSVGAVDVDIRASPCKNPAVIHAATRLVVLVSLPVLGAWAGPVHRVTLDGPVNSIQAEYVIRAFDVAEREGSELVLLELNTPGGLADAMEQIVQRMLASRVPTCAYVYPPGGRAASAGFFILETADVAAMAPGTRTGAAHPVMAIGGVIPIPDTKNEEQKGEKEPEKAPESAMMTKVREDIQAYLRGIVQRRGRNVEAAELAVTESRSYTADEALEKKLVEYVVSGEWELLSRLDGLDVRLADGTPRVLRTRDAPIVSIDMTFRERALAFITDPNIAFLLFLVGALLLYIEITHAGFVLPGVIGGICLLLAVMGFSFLPISVVGVLLILGSIGLFVAEAVVGAFGVLAIAGVVCLALGGIMLVDLPEEGLSVDPYLAVGAAVGFGAIAVLLATLAVRVFRRKVETGAEGMVGMVGEAVSDIALRGKVFVGGEYWDAVAKSPIPKGAKVRATGMKGLVLEVEAEPGEEKS